jgi:hypothetical protein
MASNDRYVKDDGRLWNIANIFSDIKLLQFCLGGGGRIHGF